MLKSSSTFQPQGTMLILLTLLEFEPFREFSSNSCGFELIWLAAASFAFPLVS
jgi:hypothetical protein